MQIIQPSLRDFGNPDFFPALKRRAIFVYPVGTMGERRIKTNNQRPTSNERRRAASLDVRCWMLDVGCSMFPPS